MDLIVFVAVLAAAACHAGWNAVIKVGGDPLTVTALLTGAAGVVALLVMPVVGLPDAAAWPWVAASVIVHLFYFGSLIEAYRHGDLGQVYPIARGGAPLMTAAVTTTVLAEPLGANGWAGLVLLVAGVVVLSLRGARVQFNRHGVFFALLTAMTICAYTLIDGIGARVSGNPVAYTASLFAGCGAVMLVYGLVWRGAMLIGGAAQFWASAVLGGVMQLGSYGVAIWAMSVAPIAMVAALRETSVLFGALMAVVFLKEPLRSSRAVAALLIVAGLVMLRLA